jgi:hypothetical protein
MKQMVSRKGAKTQRKIKRKLFGNRLAPSVLCAFAPLRELPSFRCFVLIVLIASLLSCAADEKQVGIPPAAQTTIDAVTADIAAERDEKIYREAAEQWRQASTLDETKEFFKTLRVKLGSVKTRTFHTARGEQNVGSATPAQTLNIQYQTTFERAAGMETFTLVEQDGRWLLARYFVNSEALK